jgi:hypothetical protein
VNGTANTGGGGGGGGTDYVGNLGGTGGTGGSGVVVFRYAGSAALATGGTIAISGGYVTHTFTASGSLGVT